MRIGGIKVLVLGNTGMLGSTVAKYLTEQGIKVLAIDHKYPSKIFEYTVVTFDGDYIVNCIGAIPQRSHSFKVNTDLPIWLSNNSPCRVIHPGTDCETDSTPYGISKRLAREYIEAYSTNTKVLQTSIIGHEEGTCHGLLEWFLAQKDEVEGYTEAMWNGITTLEWASQAFSLMQNWDGYKTTTVIQGESVSKYELLTKIKEVYGRDTFINPVSKGKDKRLVGDIVTKPLHQQLEELKKFK